MLCFRRVVKAGAREIAISQKDNGQKNKRADQNGSPTAQSSSKILRALPGGDERSAKILLCFNSLFLVQTNSLWSENKKDTPT